MMAMTEVMKALNGESGKKKPELVIRGSAEYVQHMFKHLAEEHPSTKRRMRIIWT